MCFSRRPWASDRARGSPTAGVLFSGGIAFSFRGGVVPGLRPRRQSGHGTVTGASSTQRQGSANRRCSLPKVHAAHVPERRGAHGGFQGLLLTICPFLV